MKIPVRIILFFVFQAMIAHSSCAGLSDSLSPRRYEVGLKFSGERAAWQRLSPTNYKVYNGGLQFVSCFRNSNASLETGIYQTSKVWDDGTDRSTYRFLNIPVNLRFDKYGFYMAAGPFVDYLIGVKGRRFSQIPLDKNRMMSLGLDAALGFEKNLAGPWSLAFEGRYYLSFFEFPDRLRYRSYGLALGLNYKINR